MGSWPPPASRPSVPATRSRACSPARARTGCCRRRARRTSPSSCATAPARSPRGGFATPTCTPGASTAATSCGWPGGLPEHTGAVAALGVEACALHPRLDQDLLLTAATLNDLGRTREFALGAEIGLTDEGRLLGHVALGLRILDEHAARTGLDDARRLALAHCVLTHHGADAAPQRRFASPEAVALHRLNALDAGVKGALEQGSAPAHQARPAQG